MSRVARVKSISGIYHVMMRGANRQDIFHDDEDRIRFLETIQRFKGKSEMEVYAWCLMNNHAHLLLKEGKETLSVTMKRIGVSFVWYYNEKYQTSGHLFQGRFKSENVDSNRQLFTTIRYIHQNPLKAGMVNQVDDWKWSSCLGYYGKSNEPEMLLDYEVIYKRLSAEPAFAKESFKEFNERANNDECLEDLAKKRRLTDQEAEEGIKKLIDIDIVQVKTLPKPQKDKILRKIKTINGVSQRQAARILGISHILISKA